MKRTRLAQLLTVFGLAALLTAVWLRSSVRSEPAGPAREPTPQDALYEMFDAVRAADPGAYLQSFAGAAQDTLRQTANEQGMPSFGRYLKEMGAAVKGIAVDEPQKITADEVRVRVELVYADRNEAQWFYLERQPDARWRIVRLDPATRVPNGIRYGSPAN